MVFTFFFRILTDVTAMSCFIMVAFEFIKQMALEEESMKLKTWVQISGLTLAL